jgi:GNAT superfamily N-acetyltransferase
MVLLPDALCLRMATDADAAALATLRSASCLEMGLLGHGEAPAFRWRARREIATLLREERMLAWVLVVEGRVAGCACVLLWDRLPYPGSSRHAEIAGVYVDPAFRRRGIARELVAEAIATAAAAGVRRTFIAPTLHSRALYRSFGFDDAGWLKSPLHASRPEPAA